MSRPSEPAWLLKVFALALSDQNAAVLANLATASDHNEFPGGVLCERSYQLVDIDAIIATHKDTDYVIVPPTDVVMMPSLDVPQGRIHHVMHFEEDGTRVFSRLYTEPASETRGRGGRHVA